MEASSSSSLARWRPAFLVVAGGATAYGVWLAYSLFTKPRAITSSGTGSGLRRSNAVRHPHHSTTDRATSTASRHEARSTAPLTERSILDTASIHLHNGTTLHIALDDVERYPTVQFFRTEHGLDQVESEEAMSRFEDTVIELWIQLRHGNDPRHVAVHQWLENRGVAAARVLRAVETEIQNGHLDVSGEAEGTVEDEAQTESHETANELPSDTTRRFQDGHHLKSLLYYIAEDQARNEGFVHRGVTCNSCDAKPIRGIRWRCANCADYDLCSDCEAMGMHPKTHIFYKVRIPAPFLGNPRQAQQVLYPGRPHLTPRFLPNTLRRQLIKESRYETSEMDALWDQFTSLANFQLMPENDPHALGAAIDRKAFDKAFVPHSAISPPAPNLIYDRMFSFYDTNGDNLIDFPEFVKGLAILHRRIPCNRNRITFNGYDINGDGLVGRTDFLRMFRAYYTIQKEITRDLIAVQEEEYTSLAAQDTILSSQPVNSAFTDSPIFSASRGVRTKQPGETYRNGSVTRPDGDDSGDRRVVIREAQDGRSRPLIRRRGSTTDRLYDRWRRRRFYTDQEEGWSEPEGYESDGFDSEEDDASTAPVEADAGSHPPEAGGYPVSPRSRSSSKVRFQDVDGDARSVASSSSRPVGERWGSFDIPEGERDIGREILYQVTQQGFNELLDPLFKDKEDLGVEVKFTKPARRHWKSSIMAFMAEEGADSAVENERRTGASFLPDAYADKSIFFEDSVVHVSWLSRLWKYEYLTVENWPEAQKRLRSILNHMLLDLVQERFRDEMDVFIEQYRIPDDWTSPLFKELFNICKGRSVMTTGSRPPSAVRAEAYDEMEIKMGVLDHLLQTSGYSVDADAAEELQPRPADARAPSPAISYTAIDEQNNHSTGPASPALEPDMTFPQFRPNSQADLDRMLASRLANGTGASSNGQATPAHDAARVPPRTSSRQRSSNKTVIMAGDDLLPTRENPWGLREEPPSQRVLTRLAMLEREAQQIQERGGDGQIDFDEFEEVMKAKGKDIGFVEQWLEVGSF